MQIGKYEKVTDLRVAETGLELEDTFVVVSFSVRAANLVQLSSTLEFAAFL